jgi:mono/diheme cytochrome c family protein
MSRKVAIGVPWGAALLVAVVCVRLVVGSAVAQAAAQESTRRTVSPPPEAKSLFNQRCAECHGSDGRAYMKVGEVGVARTFTDERWQAEVSDRRLTIPSRGGAEACRRSKARCHESRSRRSSHTSAS